MNPAGKRILCKTV